MTKMKRTRLSALLLLCLFMASVLIICRSINSLKKSDVPAFTETQLKNKGTNASPNHSTSQEKMIGIWVPYMDLDTGSTNDDKEENQGGKNTEKKFKEKFQNIISEAKNFGINTLIVHVRSHSDAMYPSKIFPWSHLLTGAQGANPRFDPLSYMVQTTHENGLKFHAWINPLRIKTKTYPEKLSSNNPYFKLGSEKYFLNHTEGICYNPAYDETRQLIIEGVKEIVKNYEVDGIHFDDYFYPQSKELTSEDCAYNEHLKSSEKKLSLQDWRKKNINTLISETYKTIKSVNNKILFGVSPPGNIKKCHESGADVALWASTEGYVDYLCPQIYWSLDYSEMPFEETASKWKNMPKSSNVKLYSGLALYKVGTDCDNGTWKNKSNILTSEFKIIEKLNYDGMALYSLSFLHNPAAKEELVNLKNEMVAQGPER